MAHKDVLFHSAAREAILRGTTQLADTVRVTLGPRSKSVLIDRKYGPPLVCNDGVTIANGIRSEGPNGEPGCQDAAAGSGKDCRRGGRRDQHRHGPSAGDLCGRRAQRGGRGKCHRHKAGP